MSEAQEHAQVTALLEQLGADAETAPVMATQLMKRAHQLADSSGTTYLEALDGLLRRVVDARNGENPSQSA